MTKKGHQKFLGINKKYFPKLLKMVVQKFVAENVQR